MVTAVAAFVTGLAALIASFIVRTARVYNGSTQYGPGAQVLDQSNFTPLVAAIALAVAFQAFGAMAHTAQYDWSRTLAALEAVFSVLALISEIMLLRGNLDVVLSAPPAGGYGPVQEFSMAVLFIPATVFSLISAVVAILPRKRVAVPVQ